MNKVTEDIEFLRFDGVTSTTVYLGGLSRLVPAYIEWNHTDEEFNRAIMMQGEYLKLSEIRDRCLDKYGYDVITVIYEGPLRTDIYQWGNYGDEWWIVGEAGGYA